MNHPLSLNWDLDTFFEGGSQSQAFASYLQRIEEDVDRLHKNIESLQPPQTADEHQPLTIVIELLQDIQIRHRHASAFVSCLTAQNVHDKKAVQLSGRIKTLSAAYQTAMTMLEQILMNIEDEVWKQLKTKEPYRSVAFPLEERRLFAKEKLPPEQEALANDLAVDGYHGWRDLYNTTVGQMTVPIEEDGETKEVSVGQASNRLSHPDRQVRKKVFTNWEKAWSEHADFCADALNHLGGFRLQLYKHRGWDSVHKEPLAINRMSQQTLDVMWDVIDRNKYVFVQYLQRKAQLMGQDALSWYDVSAPLGISEANVTYDDAAQFIVEQFRSFSPKMAEFTEQAFNKRWIEAEDRPGKRPGGFCTSFPDRKETRIFMTYAGTSSNVATLAHELGHAYHQHVMNDLPALAQRYAMNVAETASTFAELIVSNAAIEQAPDEDEKLTLLDDKVQRAVAFFMNLHARFIFETNFYEERKSGLVSVERLNELMVKAQKEAFKGALDEYHPHFWASKMHFYITNVPFYNFPYTFGYLFSSGIYAQAQQEGTDFEEKYIALLQDTASMTVEDLAYKHLNVDLTQPEFWQNAIDLSVQDAQQFLHLTENKA